MNIAKLLLLAAIDAELAHRLDNLITVTHLSQSWRISALMDHYVISERFDFDESIEQMILADMEIVLKGVASTKRHYWTILVAETSNDEILQAEYESFRDFYYDRGYE